MNANWKNVSKKHPCAICGKTDWCSYSLDGEMALCQRTPSKYPAKSGQGFIHILKERKFSPPVKRYTPPVRRLLDAEKAMDGFRHEFEAYGAKDIFDSLIEIGEDLHLVPADIDRLIVGRSRFHESWCFPMRDGDGKVVGIRLRRYHSSDKFSVSGSKDGLFYDPELSPGVGELGREIFIVEGATDTIAGYAIGLPCVGRSSCTTGGSDILALCNRLRVQSVTIVSDYDEPKIRANGEVFRPGQDGAEALAKKLRRPYRIVTPPSRFKDLRDWYSRGRVTYEQFVNQISEKWRIP